MKFKINNTEWEIKEVKQNDMTCENNEWTLGLTKYREQEILLLENQKNIIKTLKHELTHVWLYEYGHSQNNHTEYNYEDICEIVASSNDFINEIVKEYITPKLASNDIIKESMARVLSEASKRINEIQIPPIVR